jgi:HK97 family phage portal protein
MNIFESQQNANTNTFYKLPVGYNYNRVSPTKIVRDGYLSNEDVYSMVSRFARLCGSIPMVLMNGEDTVPDTDEFYRMFYDNWNEKYGKEEGLYQVFVNLFLHGNAYILKKTESLGFMPDELWALPSDKITPSSYTTSIFDTPAYYQFNDSATIHKYFPNQLIQIQYYDPSFEGEEGLSPLQANWNTVLAGNNRATAEKTMLENRGISGFISPKGTGDAGSYGFTNQVIETVRKAFATLTGGAKKFNKVELIEQAAEFTQLGMDANDMKIIEMRLNHVRSICNAYGLPSILFNDYQSRTHANYKEAMKALYTDAVIPQVKLFINQFEKHFLNQVNMLTGNKYWLKIAKEEIEPLKEDQTAISASILSQYEKNLLTKKEARLALGLSEQIEEEQTKGVELLRSLSPLLANQLISTMTEEDRNRLLKEMGLI